MGILNSQHSAGTSYIFNIRLWGKRSFSLIDTDNRLMGANLVELGDLQSY